EALITIDAAPPSSQVLPLPATTAPGDFTVNWTGADDPGGSGLARFDIYFADDRGPWTLWKTGVTETSATFTGQLGHRYAFYSIATDNVGHREAPPESADASTFVAVMPAPDLEITLTAQTIELSWPSAASDFQLEQTDALAPTPTWQRVEKQPVVSGERCTVRLAVTNSTMFYRLRKP
ncbi:MAG: hypothetical protein HYY24_16200, partial [Verrucomicrobia bacterium]|nr:hypothetical protein [Verrucomicrobiota bacterium]